MHGLRICVGTLICLVIATAQADELERDGGCSRWDQRPVLQNLGWPRAVHMGGRESSTSLAFAEAISLKLAMAITPIELDRLMEKGDSIERIVQTLSKTGACPLAEGPIDDVAFSRDLNSKTKRKPTAPPIGCATHPERRLKAKSLELKILALDDSNAIDATISRGRIPIVRWQTNGGTLDSPIEARRFSPTTDRCEWLVRQMNGPFCDKTLGGICEDGALWLPRDELKKKIKMAWEIR
ncbi:MAG: hypothetical protein V4760_13170 [Bdellovibrionota bacterium]